MTTPHGAHKKGLILCLPDLSEPFWEDLHKLEISVHEMYGSIPMICVSHENGRGSGHGKTWKHIKVIRTTRDEAIEIAKRHCAMCEEVIVLDAPTLEKGSDIIERIQPLRECNWAPVRGGVLPDKPWEGLHEYKPMDFACEVVIPCLDCNDMIKEVVALWRLQTVRPHIVLIDTGSTERNLAGLRAMAAEDLEVHSLRFNGVKHPSDFPAIAMDLAFSMCRTQKLVATHSDVFLRSRTVLADLIGQCNDVTPAVGYQMTEREHPGWEKVVSHTLSAFWMPAMWRIGGGWSLARLCSNMGVGHYPNSVFKNFPDTECLLSKIMEVNYIKPKFIGTEVNYEQTVDERIRHVRSRTGAQLYSPAHMAKTDEWLKEALMEAHTNIENWGWVDRVKAENP